MEDKSDSSAKIPADQEGGGAPDDIGSEKEKQQKKCLSLPEVRAIFKCLTGGDGAAREGSDKFNIIVVPKFGDYNRSGLKLSPPPYEYQEGVYVFLRLNVAIPPELSDRVLLHRDLALLPDRPWALSGPQHTDDSVDIQQRYCTPRGDKDDYRGYMKGSLWTLVDESGEEEYDIRVFHVYRSDERSTMDSPAKEAVEVQRPKKKQKKEMAKPAALWPPVAWFQKRETAKPSATAPPMPVPGAPHVPFNIGEKAALASFTPSDALALVSKRPRKPSTAKPSMAGQKGAKKIQSAPKKGPAAPEKGRPAPWSPEEDRMLTDLIANSPFAGVDGRIEWNNLARHMGTHRTGKQIRERYVNYLNPDRKKGGWTEEESELVISLQAKLGNQWSKIAQELPGRSDNDVKNRWHSRMRSLKRQRAREADDVKIDDAVGENVRANKRPSASRKPSTAAAKPSKKRKKTSGKGAEAPEVGQRVEVKLDEGGVRAGLITKVQSGSYKELQLFQLKIRFDDGVSQDAIYPDKDIRLLPNLTEDEDMLCQELANFTGAQSKSDDDDDDDDGSALKTDRSEEEESCDANQSVAKETSVDSGTAAAPSSANPSTNPTSEEGGGKDKLKSAAKGDGTSTKALSSAPSAMNVQGPAFQQGPTQQQLIAAAQLLSSVSPSRAVAALTAARQMQSMGAPNQFNFPPPGSGGANNNGETMAAMFLALTSGPSAEQN